MLSAVLVEEKEMKKCKRQWKPLESTVVQAVKP